MSTKLLIDKLAFQLLVHEIAQDMNSDLRFQPSAIDHIQVSAADLDCEMALRWYVFFETRLRIFRFPEAEDGGKVDCRNIALSLKFSDFVTTWTTSKLAEIPQDTQNETVVQITNEQLFSWLQDAEA